MPIFKRCKNEIDITETERHIKVGCDCGCGMEMDFRVESCTTLYQGLPVGEENIYLSTSTSDWDNYQKPLGTALYRKLKMIWAILRGKEYIFTEIYITRENWEVFKEQMKEF